MANSAPESFISVLRPPRTKAPLSMALVKHCVMSHDIKRSRQGSVNVPESSGRASQSNIGSFCNAGLRAGEDPLTSGRI